MTPAARLQAAADILDTILAGQRAEHALTAWGRANRFAGSGDRAALRDIVFQALRCRRSQAWLGGPGPETGRGLVLGGLRAAGTDPAPLFTGARHAPPPLGPADDGRPLDDAPEAVRLDLSDWLLPLWTDALGGDASEAAEALRHRAPVWVRCASGRTAEAAAILAGEDISTRPHPGIPGALEVTGNARRIARSAAYEKGLVELQDASSQAVTLALGPVKGLRVLDYCAGAGGKSLHLADLGAEVTAHDAEPRRMRDLAPRAARAGLRIATAGTGDLPDLVPWPLVLIDAPCSGSGTWRRDPEGKWAMTPARLEELTAVQDSILDAAAALTAPGGRLAHVTCSVLPQENEDRVAAFLARHPGWARSGGRRTVPGPLGDGFSVAILARRDTK